MSNTVKTMLAVGACKTTRNVLRLLHRGGTTTPGRVAMKLDADILETVSKGMEIIVVTGTNGKTTTSNMIEHALSGSGRDVLANKSGANLLPGVTAEFTSNATATGKPKKHYAVIECDEGALKQVVPRIHPKVIVVTNLFRDQLDRYGEVMHTLEEIRKGIKMVPDAILCLNADDSLTASLAIGVPNPVTYFGIDCPVGEQENLEISDARYCIRCGTEYVYDYHTYAHLGGFRCPKCGYSRIHPAVAVTEIERVSSSGSTARIRFGRDGSQAQDNGNSDLVKNTDANRAPVTGPQTTPATDMAPDLRTIPTAQTTGSDKREETEQEVSIGLPAVYNIYNGAAAIAAYQAAGFDRNEVISSLADVHSSFGRMETFRLGEVPLQMILVKNPAGCNQALSYLASLNEDYQAVFCLNDRTADGHDISWIWDADFEKVCRDPHMKHAFVVGDRADDMQLRLKYAGASERVIEKMPDNAALIEKLQQSSLPVFILPNYTSMLSLRAALSTITGKQAFWKG
ncbi:MAG: MurT ligase domain-containing protein [Bilifractor sp.]